MAIVLTIAFLLLYSYGLFRWDKLVSWRLDGKISRTIKYVHYSTLIVSLTVLLLYTQFDIGLRGLWTTRIIIMTTISTGVFFIFISDKNINNKIERIYFKVFSFLPVATAGFLLIPFLGVVLVFSLFGQLISPSEKIFYQDQDIIIQSSFVGVLGPPRIDIFQKKQLFEKHVYRSEFFDYNFDSLQVHYDADSTRIKLFGSAEYEDNTKTICIDKVK
jgi:hypothetical protein